MIHDYEVVIIGGGQAGLAAGRQAQSQGLNYIILEASNTVGSAWRKRYDSLTLFTPRSNSALIGGVGTDAKVIIDRIAGSAKTAAARDNSEVRR